MRYIAPQPIGGDLSGPLRALGIMGMKPWTVEKNAWQRPNSVVR